MELRILGREGRGEQAADLADACHNIPIEMYGSGNFSWNLTRGMLEDYQRRWPGKTFDYVYMLDQIRRAV